MMNRLRHSVGFLAAVAATFPVGVAWAESGSGIDVDAKVTGQKYCIGEPTYGFVLKELPPDAITLRAMIRLTYHNRSESPQIFQQLPDINIVISPTLRDVQLDRRQTIVQFGARRPELEFNRDELESRPPEFPFLTLPHNGSHQITYDVGLQVHNPADKSGKSDFLGKRIYFQLDLNHALVPEQTLQDLKAKWRAYGTVWASRIRTPPIQIDIAKSPATSRCTSEFTID